MPGIRKARSSTIWIICEAHGGRRSRISGQGSNPSRFSGDFERSSRWDRISDPKMRLELSARIESDLSDIGDYIALHNPIRARSFVDELIAEIERVGRHPLTFRLRPDIGPEARAAVYGNYVILFR